jgi:hypothetical protein
MSLGGIHAPVPPRSRLIVSVRDWSPLEEVSLAVSQASQHETRVYVERLGDLYRWSLICRGGPYPLLRITARFLQVDYQSLFIGCREVGDGYSALSTPEDDQMPDASMILSVSPNASREAVESLVREALG